MEFDELRFGSFRPFLSWMSVKSGKERGIIPEEYFHVFSDYCECGSERMIRIRKGTTSITGVTCCNPRCRYKQVYQLNEIFKRFGAKEVGPALCREVVDSFYKEQNDVTIAEIIIEGESKNPLSGDAEVRWYRALKVIADSRVPLGEFLSKLAYPTMDEKFIQVFQGINSMKEFTEIAAREGGIINFFASRGVMSLVSIYYFLVFAEEIEIITNYFSKSLVATSKRVLPICMSGHMETSLGKFSKAEFVRQCNVLCEFPDGSKAFDIVSVGTVNKASFAIIGRDSVARGTPKYLRACEIQEHLRSSGELSKTEKFWFYPDEFLQFLVKGVEINE